LLAGSLGACATFGGGTPEEIVAKRAQAYWDARIDGDAKAAYKFTSPSYRAQVDEQKFVLSHSKTYALAAKVKSVKCEAEVCESGTILQVKPPLMGVNTSTIDLYYAETWVQEDGQWWVSLKP